MIRIATLYQTHPFLSQFNPTAIPPAGPLDILCCQIRQQETQHAQGYLQDLAASLQMTCSSTLLAGHGANTSSWGATVLSIFTGSGVWVLNIGSVALAMGAHEKERVQFALVRKGSVSVLVVHIPHTGTRRTRLALLRALFSHQLVREQRYSAVVLCGQRLLRLSRPDAAQLMAGTGLMLHSNLKHEMAGAGAMMLCVAREPGLAGVELGKQDSCILTHSSAGNAEAGAPVFICEFQAQARVGAARKKPHYLLSFAEQWAGYKEHFRPSAL